MSTSYEIDIFHKYAYIYTKDLFGVNRYIVPLSFYLIWFLGFSIIG